MTDVEVVQSIDIKKSKKSKKSKKEVNIEEIESEILTGKNDQEYGSRSNISLIWKLPTAPGSVLESMKCWNINVFAPDHSGLLIEGSCLCLVGFVISFYGKLIFEKAGQLLCIKPENVHNICVITNLVKN